ncbi:MAG: diol dehydratase small subunit [Pseudomonadota bacterium]|nr:diol dehydratase small subunit [Pseudomonadota bacterium]
MKGKLGIADYPLSEKRPELVRGPRGKPLDDVTLDNLVAGGIGMEDLRITSAALGHQAEIARAAGRPRLAENFERAGELVDVPQDFILQVYELLRPGRARAKADLLKVAATLRTTYTAERLARFVEEAAEVYDRRGLFTHRY